MRYRVIVKNGRCYCPYCKTLLRFRNSNGYKRKKIGRYCEYCGIEIAYPNRIIGGEGIFDEEMEMETEVEMGKGTETESESEIENVLRLLCNTKTLVSVLLKGGRRLGGSLERNEEKGLYRIWEYEFSANKVKQIWVKM